MRILFLNGDGISDEIVSATHRVLEASSLSLDITFEDVGFRALDHDGITISDETIERARQADGIVLGPVSHMDYPPTAEGGLNPSGVLRKKLDLYANIRPAKTYDAVPRPVASSFDLIVARENTEGFYADRTMHVGTGEIMPTEDLALAIRKVTRKGSSRIARAAFELAARDGRKVTCVHKGNVLRVSDGLFLEEVRKVRSEFSTLEFDEILVDAAAAHMVRHPDRFGVIVTTNMFGDILSDLASELSGGLGLAGSLNQGDNHAMAQAQHGSAPDIAGQDCANPTSLILSAAMLLDWLSARYSKPELAQAGTRIKNAVTQCLSSEATRTSDLGGALGTKDYTEVVIRTLREAN
ncbi:MAG: isocitrate/isopropylmalate dehydrogenase family protein [Pseudomonadota bacterium]